MKLPSLPANLLETLPESERAQVENALHMLDQAERSSPAAQAKAHRPRGWDVAGILLRVHLDTPTLLAALLSDMRLDGEVDEARIATEFGEVVANLVRDVRWLNHLSIYSADMANQPTQTEILRRMLLSMTHDVRAVLIKLAYRIQRLRGIAHEPEEIRHFIARETLDIYSPLANRLGISQFKWELEDLAFRCLEPEQYQALARSLMSKRRHREQCIQQFQETLHSMLQQHGLTAKVYGRPKHLFSIWCKMQRKRLPLDELYDLLAVRVIVEETAQCYAVLGLAHSHWQYIPKEFDDYIANPKENGYQSLHTVVLDALGNRIEIQIRTKAMHEFAELGVAAHWRYKEGGKYHAATEKNIASLRQLLEERNQDNLLENFHAELFSDRVFVLTPAGQLVDLIKGATPLDFAYAVHTDVGHRCRGAKINGQIKPLTYVLQSGEQVEIITGKTVQPNRNWLDPNLGYLKTPRALGKVKSWFKQQQFSDNVAAGKQLLEKELRRLGLKTVELGDLIKQFKVAEAEQFYHALGRGDINSRQLAAALKIPELAPVSIKLSAPKNRAKSDITVADMDNVVTTLARCCSPVKGDAIVGYVSLRRGITIHRNDCANLQQLQAQQPEQVVKADWSGTYTAHHTVPIVIQASSAQTLLADVSVSLNAAKVQISEANLKTHPDDSATLILQCQISNTQELSAVLSKINQLPHVLEARRKA
jgi:GTP pyrophosphokinase